MIFSKKILTLLFTVLVNSAIAQHLPETQTIGLRSPSDIKIDGKLLEWKDGLQAKNHATELFYSLSNDDQNLYLTVQAAQPRIIQKIMLVGLDLIVNTKNKKDTSAKVATTITFPQMRPAEVSKILSKSGIKTLDNALKSRRSSSVDVADTSLSVANVLLTTAAKDIKIKGAKIELPDTLISVYNELGIKVAAAIDEKKCYNYELAVPLKVLGLSKNSAKKFSYSLQLQNRLINMAKGGITVSIRFDKSKNPVDVDQDLDSTTNFWSEYTLASTP